MPLPNKLAWIIFPVLLVAYARLARREEEDALARFGDAYRDYQRRTSAFFPRFGRPDAHGHTS